MSQVGAEPLRHAQRRGFNGDVVKRPAGMGLFPGPVECGAAHRALKNPASLWGSFPVDRRVEESHA